MVDNGKRIEKPQAVNPETGVDNPPPLYNDTLAKSCERLNTKKQLLFVKICNNY